MRCPAVLVLLLIAATHATRTLSQVQLCDAVATRVQAEKTLSTAICASAAELQAVVTTKDCTEFIEGYRSHLGLVAAGDVPAAVFCNSLDLYSKDRNGCSLWEGFACISPIHAATLMCHKEYGYYFFFCRVQWKETRLIFTVQHFLHPEGARSRTTMRRVLLRAARLPTPLHMLLSEEDSA